MPLAAQAARPIDLWFEFQLIHRKRLRPHHGGSQSLWPWQRLERGTFLKALPPKSAEHAERFAAAVLNRPRFMQQRRVERLDADPLVAQGTFDVGVAFNDRGLITAIPKHRVGAGLKGKRV